MSPKQTPSPTPRYLMMTPSPSRIKSVWLYSEFNIVREDEDVRPKHVNGSVLYLPLADLKHASKMSNDPD